MDLQRKDNYILLGLNIAYYRKLQGFTQDQLAEKVNMDRTTIGKLENALVGASLDTLFKIASALEIPLYKLLDCRE